ncbi:MAG: hypothetical protein M3Z75_25040 [Actinomycetota bacterium]|nr:hypothetical protein [Actinomycetota bacterium]
MAPEIYRRHAAALYQQALLILGDESSAEQVARDVILDELTRSASRESADVAARRLAVSVLRRCQALTAGLPPDDQIPRPRPPGTKGDRAGSPDLRCRQEREALSLVLFGGLGYREVGRELALPAPETAALLRAALISFERLSRQPVRWPDPRPGSPAAWLPAV